MKLRRHLLRTAIVASGLSAAFFAVGATGRSLIGRSLTAENAAPTLMLEKTRHDFGPVANDSVLRAVFAVRNNGGRRLLIVEDACSSCGLTVNESPIIVGPGEQLELIVQFQTGEVTGRFNKRVRYTTNDPQQPGFVLTLIAEIPKVDGS